MNASKGIAEPINDLSQMYPSINIVGAGIGGLSLACHLRCRRIPFTIFDAASKPKGHNYGITISSWGYKDLLGTLEPKLDTKVFRDLIAVDGLVGGYGNANSSPTGNGGSRGEDIRASDMALREILARGHQINWKHKVTSVEQASEGLKLKFENGKESIANITIDAGGERSGLLSLLLPDLNPGILPYAVYHGSRYIPQSAFNSQQQSLFLDSRNVQSFPPAQTTEPRPWHLQIAKAHITQNQVPSKVTVDAASPEEPIVEFRYTFSRPANTSAPDALYNPKRAKDEATQIPEQFFTEIETYLSSSSLPQSLRSILSSAAMKQDRILNWLMRVKSLDIQDLRARASKTVIAIGDAVHSTPPVGSEGASLAMLDAEKLAVWIEDRVKGGRKEDGSKLTVDPEEIMRFYDTRVEEWRNLLDESRARLENMHLPATNGQMNKLSGRI